MTKPWIVTKLAEVAEFFTVSTQTVKAWRQDGMPGEPGTKQKPGKWDLSVIVAWKFERMSRSSVPTGNGTTAELEQQKLFEEIRFKRLKNDETESKLISVDSISRAMVAWAVKLRSRIMSIPSEVALLVPGELKAVVTARGEDSVRVALKEAYDAEFANEQVRALIISEGKRLSSDDRIDASSGDASE